MNRYVCRIEASTIPVLPKDQRVKFDSIDEAYEEGWKSAQEHITLIEDATPLNDLAKSIHENAVAHGWWDEERSFGDIVALCHSELSEALEEYRAKKPLAYCKSEYTENGMYGINEPDDWSDEDKPEGIAVEMIDCIIRILDWCGKEGVDVDKLLYAKHEYNRTRPYRHGGKAL